MQWIDGNTHPIETMLDQCCLGLGKGVVDEEEREHIRKIILNQRKLKNIVNETLLFVETRAAPSPHDAYLGSDKVGRPGEDGKCFRKGSVCSDIDSGMNGMTTTLITTTTARFAPCF